LKKYQNQLFHLWFPSLLKSQGGIQTYSYFLLQSWQAILPQANHHIFTKHDKGSHYLSQAFPLIQHQYVGKFPSFLRSYSFAIQLLVFGILERPQLILSTHLNFLPVAYQLNRLVGIPYWVVAHGIEAWNIQKPSIKRALRQADCILAVSNYTRNRLIQEQGLPSSQVKVLPNTFDAGVFCIKSKPEYLLKRHGLSTTQPIIMTVARLSSNEQYKGYDQIVRALPDIRKHVPEAHYVLVGKGDDHQRVEALTHNLGLTDCVTLAGYVPDSELCDYYNLSDVFAMPSQGEGFGIVYLEAMACGKPCLGGNQDGALDALCHGELGALVNPDDVKEIAETLVQILQGTYPNSLMYQPEALRQKVIETYGFQRFQQTLAQYLNDFLK
jgi:glycosyltransferase involved in cell wall biosynthesis